MKYVILLGDGMADYSLSELQGRTVLEAARTPAMDRIAAEGTIGLIDTIPAGMPPGSDVANLSILGYDPLACRAGRGALEAVSMGLTLEKKDVAFRCNLVTIVEDESGRAIMDDFTADHIGSDEAARIMGDLDRELGGDDLSFHPGVGYRHLLIWKAGPETLETTPPHDITGMAVKEHFPRGNRSDRLKELIKASQAVLSRHPVNQDRLKRGKKPATAIWPWGQGGVPPMRTLTERFGISGALISAVDLLKGIGICAGLEALLVPGATGYIDTNYRGKAEKALEWLQRGDFVFLHVEAPDEMGHEGNVKGKIAAIEDFDDLVVAEVLRGLESSGEAFRLIVLSDHATPVSLKTHVSDPSPFAMLSSRTEDNRAAGGSFCEKTAAESGILIAPGCALMDCFLGDWGKCLTGK